MVAKITGLLAITATASAAVLDLPVAIKNTYPSVRVDIGTPPKEHRLLFDTGSSTIFIVNTDCTDESCPHYSAEYYTRQKYNASASSTAEDLGSAGSIEYLGGKVAGDIYQDVYSLLDGKLEWNQTFLSANESSWGQITADGFLGLGFSSIAEPNTSTLVETLLWENKLDAPRFGLFYGTNLNDEGAQDGILTVGGSKEDTYVEGETIFTPLRKEDPYQLWRTPLRSVNIIVAQNASDPNAKIDIHHGKLPTTPIAPGTYLRTNVTWNMFRSGRAVFDTGAGTLGVPEETLGAMYYNLGWNLTKLISHEETMECKHSNASWAVTLTLGDGDPKDDVSFSIRGDEFYKPGDMCMPPLSGSGVSNFALVGAAFLRRYYSVYDFGANQVAEYKPRIGFGRLKKQFDYLYQ